MVANCNSRVLFKTGVILGTPLLIASRSIGYHFIISIKGDINIDTYWDISIDECEYISFSKRPMNNDEKEDLYNIINNNWEEIRKELKSICTEDCGAEECKFYSKTIPDTFPDYRLL